MADSLVNRCSFTLAAAVTSGTQTSITRTSATDGLPGDSNGPASGTYVYMWTDGSGNYELCRVTGGQGTTTLTIARAVEAIGGTQTALVSVPSGTVCYAIMPASYVQPASYDTTVLTKLSLAPVAYWKLNDPVGSSTAADSSGNGYTLTVNGTVTFGEPSVVPSDSETSAQSDGTTGYLISTGTPALLPAGASAMTIIAAIRPPANTNPVGKVLFLSGISGYQFGLNQQYLQWDVNGGGSGLGVLPPLGGINHLIGASYDGYEAAVYMDGRLVLAYNEGAQAGAATTAVLLAQLATAYWSNFPVGRFAVFAGVLTPKDWALLMQAFTGVG